MLLHGDCLSEMKKLPDDSVDLIVTDPPYGYSFMGKDWDKAVVPTETWVECLRVLKPGAFAFVMSAPRQDVLSKVTCNLSDAGFDIGFTPMYHTYATGFPKSLNVHKKLTKDKEASKHKLQELWRAIIHSTSPDEQSINGSSLSSLLEDLEQGEQCEVTLEGGQDEAIQVSERQRESCMEGWSDLPKEKRKLRECKVCEMPTGLFIDGKKRWVCYGTQASDGKITWQTVDEEGVRTSFESQGSGQQIGKLKAICVKCGTQALRTLGGAFGGFNPKPAVEVILVCMKPLSEKTYVDQALKNGKGITWLDDCRVPASIDREKCLGCGRKIEDYDKVLVHKNDVFHTQCFSFESCQVQPKGRFPANLLVSDDVLNDGVVRKSGGGNKHSQKNPTHFSGLKDGFKGQSSGGDSGSYSRFFDLDAWAKQNKTADGQSTVSSTFPERHDGESSDSAVGDSSREVTKPRSTLAEQTVADTTNPVKTFPFLIVPKASKREKNEGLEHLPDNYDSRIGDGIGGSPSVGGKRENPQKNVHPTVKPLKLMSYLITLGSREGDTVLDPFLGSGTTALAAKNLKREYIGIEMSEEYIEIAKARLK